jgi:hypothetical protein
MTLITKWNQQIHMTSASDTRGEFFEDYETALIVAGRRFPNILYWRDEFASRSETLVQFGTNYSWVCFRVVNRVTCECGRSFGTNKGLNAHRGARGNCKEMNER